MSKGAVFFGIFAVLFLLTACGTKENRDHSENTSVESTVQTESSHVEESSGSTNEAVSSMPVMENNADDISVKSGLIAEQILNGADPIQEDCIFPVKGSQYRLSDLVDEEALTQLFGSGICLIFRLQAVDYHHFCYIDDGFQYTNHFIEGMLHSVQPAACERVPVYWLNRRMWTLMDTKHFGKMIQIGVGAFLVGGIVHEASGSEFRKGQEMGHFELAGSTVVQLFQEGRIRLREEIQDRMATGEEVRVRMGEMIGSMR